MNILIYHKNLLLRTFNVSHLFFKPNNTMYYIGSILFEFKQSNYLNNYLPQITSRLCLTYDKTSKSFFNKKLFN